MFFWLGRPNPGARLASPQGEAGTISNAGTTCLARLASRERSGPNRREFAMHEGLRDYTNPKIKMLINYQSVESSNNRSVSSSDQRARTRPFRNSPGRPASIFSRSGRLIIFLDLKRPSRLY